MPGPTRAQLSADILALCTGDLAFALAGVCEAEPTRYERAYRDWIGANKHGDMGYLARNVEVRIDPRLLLDGARSIIMVADQYATRQDATDPPLPDGHGRIARYARGDDYHVVMKKRLHQLADTLRERFPDAGFRACVDTAPLLEREHAARAGLGWIAKNSLLTNPQLGSYLFLGALLTTLDLEPTRADDTKQPRPGEPGHRETPFPITDHCGTCTRCIDACPTDAITPYSVDASRCISYLTIEHRSTIDERFAGKLNNWLFGCDICQEVCPHNSPRPEATQSPAARLAEPGLPSGTTSHAATPTTGTPHPAYAPRKTAAAPEGRTSLDLREVMNWTEDDRREAFRKSAMKRVKLDAIKGNADSLT